MKTRYSLRTLRSLLFICGIAALLVPLVPSQKSDARLKEADSPISRIQLSNAMLNLAALPLIPLLPPPCTPQTGLIISEFRFRGAAGPNDEFIELHNATDNAITVCTADGSAGWAVAARNAAATAAATVFVVPNGTVIPARGHYLAVNNSVNGYSLGSYPSGVGTTATGDLTYPIGIDDNSGIALFNTANGASFSTSTRLDAIGFSGPTGALADLYREGVGYPPIGTTNGQYTVMRRIAGGLPVDANDNASDLWFLSTTAGTFGGSVGSALGAPGPENLSSPVIRNSILPILVLDGSVASSVAPNRFRDNTSDPANNSTLGTMALRKRVVNTSGAPVTRLRFQITAITTYPPPNGTTADLRLRSSGAVTISNVNDAATCAATGTPATPPCTVTVQGTTVEEPPSQPMGGGLNTTATVHLSQPLAAGASINVQFLLGIQQNGSFSFFLNSMALSASAPPAAPSGLSATTASSSQINLAWTDNSNDETGFKIERKTGAGGTYSEIGTVGPNVSSYNNTGLSSNTQYFYRVRATNSSGDSAYSAEGNASTTNQLPSVSLTAPANSQVFSAPANISLTASASDPDGTISKVQFFQGATLLNEDTSAPFSFNWNSVTAGNYSLTAKAFDNGGATTTSTAITITVNTLPSVSLTTPTTGTGFTAPANVTLTATASDSDGSISKVQFFSGSTLVNEDTAAPYSFAWSNVGAGSYSLTAKAFDNLGGTTTSTVAQITVNALPAVSLTAPTNGQVFPGPADSITLTATASDPDGTISKVQFFRGGTTLIGEDTTAPYSVNWNSVAVGTYSLTAKAFDNSGATTTSAAVSITVNTLPSVVLTKPALSQIFPAPSNVTLTASASDPDGTISKVEFYQGTTLLNIDASAPYSFLWTNVPMGSYSLTAKAFDNLGSTTTSPPITIYVGTAPSVSITSPTNPTTLIAPATFTITATAVDADGSIAKVAFFSGSALLGEDTTAPYTFTVNNAGRGVYDLVANATDNTGVTAISNFVTVTVTDRPITSISSPPNNTTILEGANITISANASDDTSVSKVEFFQNDVLLGQDTLPPYEFAWNSIPAGTYSLTTRATDNLGVTGTSAPVTLNVVGTGLVSRLDPGNETGGGTENALSRNYNWSVPLINLPGRAGLDLGLTLSYNSLVWTRTGSFVTFDDDAGFPSPGFRLGFPVIQGQFFNSEAGKNAYLLITTDGSRVELRQVGTSTFYESVDSSHLLLDSTTMVLRTTNGTQLSYVFYGSEFKCTQVKDRNGNFITATYTGDGRINTVVDTVGRTINFNYNTSDNTLTSITQSWGGTSHVWASFTYTNTTVQTGFINVTKFGPANGATVKTLRSVTLNDNSRFEFDYTSWIQVSKINRYAADGHLLNYRSYNLPPNGSTQLDDCPRFTERRDWAENFNRGGAPGTSGLPSGSEEEVLSGAWTVPAATSWTLPDGTNESGVMVQMTLADGSYDKIYFAGTAGTATGWKRGFPLMIETYGKTTPNQSTAIKQRTRVSMWTQDDENLAFLLNPRVKETHVYDFDGSGQIKNHARKRITYKVVSFGNGTSCNLPDDVFEYQANATTVLRRMHTDYHTPAGTYITAHVVGLQSESTMYEVNPVTGAETLMTRVAYNYDEPGSIVGNDAPVQHDNTNYSSGFVAGRGNLSSVRRYNVVTGASTLSSAKFDTSGSLRASIDPLNHQASIGYADSFSDGINHNTLAYPTSVTDPDGFVITSQHNFDFGRITRLQTPPPAGHAVGPIKKFTYDSKTRLEQVTIEIDGNADYSHTRFVYPEGQNRVDTYTTIEAGQGEALTFKLFDGHGRTIGDVSPHPGSSGGFAARLMLFDKLGRTIKESNPTETNTSGSYLQWAATGDDSPANGGSGWVYTTQNYDWNNRPLITTNPDGTSRTASYDGCGCAGGDTATFTSEGTAADGTIKQRQQKVYHDILGRVTKTEIFNWDGSGPNGTNGTVYSTTVNTYNARDQIIRARKFQGSPADPNAGSCLSESLRFGTDNTWKQTRTLSSGWQNVGFDDSSWSQSVDEGGSTTQPWGGGFIPNTPAHWIWYYDSRFSADTSTVYFRKGFIATSNAATLSIRADNVFTAYLNGVQVATGNQWQITNSVNLTLTPGATYVLAIEVVNQGGPGGLIAEVSSIGTSCEQGLMTYDGYGRLKTRHVPGQDLSGATTFNYDDDDTLTSTVDARGAITTFSHANNNRHLVSGITYDVPAGSGITDPADVTYGYDGVGNRTSMTDGMGSMLYQYDQLSRVSKETRNFADQVSPFLNASYELNYQYNLANQPKKITDHTNSTIAYNYDQVGRVTGITGENNLYAGVSTYASTATYRAWNALKGVTYGNNYTTSVKYNSRLLGIEYEVSGRPAQFGSSTVMKTQYSYYDDGTVKFAHDTLDERFDRANSYDNVGRLKEAYTGSEARDYRDGTNSGPPTGPYRQSYQYDVYDHITQRNNRFWSQFDSFNASFANNRRQDPAFQYDGEGNLTKDSDLNYTYDAANRNVTTFNFVGTGSRSSTLSYDGDGRQLKKSVTQSSTTTATYYVRSSVLGGRVVTELNGQGIKQKGFVYAGAQEIARQENNAVVWEHVNPLTGSSGESFANGSYMMTNQADPMGVNVGTEDPFSGLQMTGFEPTPERPMIFPLLDEGGGCSFTNPNCTTCTLDGFSIGCDRAMHLVDIGAADILVTLSNGSRVPLSAPGGCPLGVCRIWVPAEVLDIFHPEEQDPDVVRVFTDESRGFWYTFSFPLGTQGAGPQGQQQDPIIPLPNIVEGLEVLLRRGDCGKFTEQLINQVAKSTGNPLISDYVPDLLSGITIDFTQQYTRDGTRVAGKAYERDANGIGKLGLSPASATPGITDYGRRFRTYEYVETVLHELIHFAGSNGRYTDRQLVEAINALGMVPPEYKEWYDSIPKDSVKGNSAFFDAILQRHCPGPQK